MNAEFPRLITLLRKEKGISQKQAAAELGISQALLSHYEKGVRECGLDFLIRCARLLRCFLRLPAGALARPQRPAADRGGDSRSRKIRKEHGVHAAASCRCSTKS